VLCCSGTTDKPALVIMEEEGGSVSHALMMSLLETFTSIGAFRVCAGSPITFDREILGQF
jgi:hypothetical protein